jgi:hypothetical protein
MAGIIDPYVYRERLTMPKLVIDAGGDEFFMPGLILSFLSNELTDWKTTTTSGTMRLRRPARRTSSSSKICCPLCSPPCLTSSAHAEHSMASGLYELVPAVVAFIDGVLTNTPVCPLLHDFIDVMYAAPKHDLGVLQRY